MPDSEVIVEEERIDPSDVFEEEEGMLEEGEGMIEEDLEEGEQLVFSSSFRPDNYTLGMMITADGPGAEFSSRRSTLSLNEDLPPRDT
jgi:hypothetical protein